MRGITTPSSRLIGSTLACVDEHPCDGPDFGARLDHARNAALARIGLARLEDVEREILLHRFVDDDADPTPLRILGRRYGVSGERVRQIQNRALAKLRAAIDASPSPSTAFG